MAFDAGMLACMTHEILSLSRGARVEKVYQPDRDEIHIQIRSLQGGKRILINAGSNNPRIGFTEIPKENPQNPPMFCVLLRKHLQGARLSNIEQLGFERSFFPLTRATRWALTQNAILLPSLWENTQISSFLMQKSA